MHHKTLIIMRHGKSDWDANTSRDFDRPLARRGCEDVPRMAARLKELHLLPDVLISSPARRAADTAVLVAENCELDSANIIYDDAVYEASRTDLLEVISRYAGSAETVMLIGHNPGLDELVSSLVPGKLPLTNKGKLMTTAAVAALECDDWQLQHCSCRLLHLLRPKELKKL